MMLVRGLLRSAVLTWSCARLSFQKRGFWEADCSCSAFFLRMPLFLRYVLVRCSRHELARYAGTL